MGVPPFMEIPIGNCRKIPYTHGIIVYGWEIPEQFWRIFQPAMFDYQKVRKKMNINIAVLCSLLYNHT